MTLSRRGSLFLPAGVLRGFENLVRVCDALCGGGLRVLERVLDTELGILAEGKRVIGEYLHALYVAQRADEVAGPYKRRVVVAYPGYKYVPYPDRLVDFVQVAEEVDDVLVPVSGKFLVDNVVYVLDVHEKQVGHLHQALDFCERFAGTPERDPARVDTRVDSCRFREREEFQHEVELCKRFAPADGNPAVLAPVRLVPQGLCKQVAGRNLVARAVTARASIARASIARNPKRAGCIPETPRLGIVAELAAHGAPLRKDDEPDSRSVDRPEGFELVYPAECHRGAGVVRLVD